MKKTIPLIVMSIKLLVRGVAILCLTLSPLMASTTTAQVKSIDEVHLRLERKSYSLMELFREIEDKTDFSFFYTEAAVNRLSGLNIAKSSGTVEQHLYQIATQTNLRFKQVNNTISVISNGTGNKLVETESQRAKISGTVKDEAG